MVVFIWVTISHVMAAHINYTAIRRQIQLGDSPAALNREDAEGSSDEAAKRTCDLALV
jgi:hypothetical protein